MLSFVSIYRINKLYKMSCCFHFSYSIMMSFSRICMSCRNREGVSGLPCSTLKMCQCSIVLYSIIIYIYSIIYLFYIVFIDWRQTFFLRHPASRLSPFLSFGNVAAVVIFFNDWNFLFGNFNLFLYNYRRRRFKWHDSLSLWQVWP